MRDESHCAPVLPGLGFLRHLLWAVYAVLRVVAGLVCRLYLQGRVQTFDEALICHRRILSLSERPNRFTLEYVFSVAEVDEDIILYRAGLRGIELPISHGSQVAMASVRQLSSHTVFLVLATRAPKNNRAIIGIERDSCLHFSRKQQETTGGLARD